MHIYKYISVCTGVQGKLTLSPTHRQTRAKSSHLICSFPTIFPFQGCQAKCHRVSFSATPPSSPLPLTISRATQVEKSTKCKEEKKKARTGDVDGLKNSSKTPKQKQGLSSRMTYTLNCHECVIRLLGDALCVCGLQFSVSWLQLPGRCNLRLSHKQIHTEKDRRVGCIFIISLLWNQSPESQKGPAARTVDFFFLHRRQKQCNTLSRRLGRPLRAVRGRAVCPTYTPAHADTHRYTAGVYKESLERAKKYRGL